MKSYTIDEFRREYPDDESCLDELFRARFGEVKFCMACGAETKWYRVKSRKCFECKHCGYQLSPTAGTIFHKSDTPLTKWFFAIFLFSNSKNGVAAMEIHRHLGVTYKTALRMTHLIRALMAQDGDLLSGDVEADEAYVGGKRPRYQGRSHKTPVLGLVQRQGHAKATVSPTASRATAERFIDANVGVSAVLHTDESPIYSHVSRKRTHETINHAKHEYARGRVSTNSIEGFWSQMKRSLDGTHHSVSPKHLQRYVDEFVYKYNYRTVPLFPLLLAEASRPARLSF